MDLKDPDLRLNLHIQQNQAVLSLDSSGDSLHKRGYRIQTNTVPLNEVLAAGILYLTGWDCNSSFIDPMCGSGTFLIEAAMMALGRVPGYYRNKFGFMRWLDYDAGLYHGIQDEAIKNERETLLFLLKAQTLIERLSRSLVETFKMPVWKTIYKSITRLLRNKHPPQPPE